MAIVSVQTGISQIKAGAHTQLSPVALQITNMPTYASALFDPADSAANLQPTELTQACFSSKRDLGTPGGFEKYVPKTRVNPGKSSKKEAMSTRTRNTEQPETSPRNEPRVPSRVTSSCSVSQPKV